MEVAFHPENFDPSGILFLLATFGAIVAACWFESRKQKRAQK